MEWIYGEISRIRDRCACCDKMKTMKTIWLMDVCGSGANEGRGKWLCGFGCENIQNPKKKKKFLVST